MTSGIFTFATVIAAVATPNTVIGAYDEPPRLCFAQSAAMLPGVRNWFGVTRGGAISNQHENQDSLNFVSGATLQRVETRSEHSFAGRSASPDIVAMSASAPRIIISGAPASGKGTQCEMIKERYGVVHLSTGDMLRQAVKDETPVGLEAKVHMDAGNLVPDEVIIGVVQSRLDSDDCKEKGWLLDGFPRTRAQADALTAAGVEADSFVLLNVPDEMLISRVVGRRLDPETGAIYHLEYSPPPADVADRLIQRADDTAEKARTRLDAYHANIDAIRECYEHITCSLDGAQSKSKVFDLICEELDSKLKVRGGGSDGYAPHAVKDVPTEPIEGMKAGTSGLRKKESAA